MPRWLFTGGTGRVGRMMLRHWRAAPPPAEIIVQSRHAQGFAWDILSQPIPDSTGPVDCLIGFAGVTPATPGDLSVNTDLAVATLRAAVGAGIGRVLLTSSSAVYGVPVDGRPLVETDPLRPVNEYGRAKVEMEEACARFRDHGVQVCCLRIGNVAGADALLLNGPRASRDDPIRIDQFPDRGGPVRSYLGPATLCRIVETLASSPSVLPAALNLASPVPVGMADLADAAGLPWVWRPAPATAYQHITLDTTAIARLHSFAPADSTPAQMVREWTAVRDPA